MSGFGEKRRAFLKEATGLLILAPREWIRVFLRRPLSPVRAGAGCALAMGIGMLAYRLIESSLGPFGEPSWVPYKIATLSLRVPIFASISLVTGLLLKANR